MYGGKEKFKQRFKFRPINFLNEKTNYKLTKIKENII